MQPSSVLVLDMGAGSEIVDNPGGDLYFYERANGPGILLDLMSIAVALDDGSGRPGAFNTVFIWGDNDPTNNGSLPPFTQERAEAPIATQFLHNGTGIGIDIGRSDGARYRFVRLLTYPEDAAPGMGNGVEVDAVERASFAMPSHDPAGAEPAATPTASATPTAQPATPTSTAMPAPTNSAPPADSSPTPLPSATPEALSATLQKSASYI